MWFDGHCHLDFDAFAADRDDVWERARAVGVTAAFVPGVTRSQWARLGPLKQRYPGLRVGLGLHPYFLHEATAGESERALDELASEYVRLGASAVGECGVDARPERLAACPLERQLALLERHAIGARELSAPLVVHVVRAHGAALELLERLGPLPAGGVLHSYSGPAELVARYGRLGFSFGFSAAVCRKGARKVVEALAVVPDERLLLETDAPDQPTPGWRASGVTRNEPSALVEVAARVAALRKTPLARLAEVTTSNAERLFSSASRVG